LLALYCSISDTVHTPQGEIERIVGTKMLFDDQSRGLETVDEKRD
jgi:hypothetical protein